MTNMVTRLKPFALILCIVVAGCSSDASLKAGLSIRDSIGIRIIENEAPLWSANGQAWTLDTIPSTTIDGDPSTHEYFLHRVRAIQRTGDGLIVVANGGTRQVLMFDPLGIFIEAIGGPGEGPGEFSSIYGLYGCTGDTIIVYEGIRLSMLDARGTFVRTELIAGRLANGRGNLEGVTSDCSAVLLVESRDRPPRFGEGVYQPPTTLYWSALDGSARDTVLIFPGADEYPSAVSGQLHFMRLPFGKVPLWDVSEDRVYYGAAERFEISIINRQGEVQELIRWMAERQHVTEADWERHAQGYRRLVQRDPSLRGNYPSPEDFPKPDLKPSYGGLLVDDQGNLWVRQYQFEGFYEPLPTEQLWWVFERTGRWLGTVRTPDGFNVLGVQHDHVVGVARDEEGVEHVRLYRLNKPGGE